MERGKLLWIIRLKKWLKIGYVRIYTVYFNSKAIFDIKYLYGNTSNLNLVSSISQAGTLRPSFGESSNLYNFSY